MIIWIERPLVLAIHSRQLAEHGGSVGVRDEGLLSSALSRPQQRHAYGEPPPDLAELAASLAFDLARNRPFLDGNQRTAHVCYRTFILLNGADLTATLQDKYQAMLGLAEGHLAEDEFAHWLRTQLRSGQRSVQEPAATYAE